MNHVLAVKTGGTLWAWGENSNGQLGLGDGGPGTDRNVPAQVGSDSDWGQVVCGAWHTLAIKTDGTLWAWGRSAEGELGLGQAAADAQHIDVPTQVGSASDWVEVVCGQNYTLARKGDGTLWAWGRNTDGQLGLGDAAVGTDCVEPTAVTTTLAASSLAAGDTFALALTDAGALWSWGSNNSGELGDGRAWTELPGALYPTVLGLGSTTHPDSARWYGNNDPLFSWTGRLNVEGRAIAGYSYLLDQLPATVPTAAPQSVSATAGFADVADGIWYFHVRGRDTAGDWGATQTLELQIDTGKPKPTLQAPAVKRGKKATITYKLTDPLPSCGRGSLTIRIKNARGKVVKKLHVTNAATNAKRTWKFACRLPKGRYTVLATGVDVAGNKAARATTSRRSEYGEALGPV